EDISGIPVGNYTVLITDANGCTANESAIVSQPTSITTSVASTDVSCNGGSDGTIDLTISGGTLPYTYSWSTGATTEDITGLIAGPYSVLITDNNGCTINENAVISEPTLISPSTSVQNISCFGFSDGAIDLTVSGGTPPYTFSWSNGATTEDIILLSAGTYTVAVTDNNGCTVNETTTLTQPGLLIAFIIPTNVSCNGAGDGVANLIVFSGVQPYTFTWSTGATTQNITGLSPGTYTVQISDANGCNQNPSVNITEPTALTASFTTIDESCPGASDGSIDLTVTGGTPPYTFAWSNGAITEDLSNLAAATFNLVLTDNNGCVINSTTNISVGTSPPNSSFIIVAANVDLCLLDPVQFFNNSTPLLIT
ncbi:SprB repeat-containing protein, partial [Candidatus Amoebophilus asiaticus]|nr:SprB repeat-containing protein [Candidatus Amoebophilus asiaticus]